MRVEGYANLDDEWYLPVHLDVGTWPPELTWQASAGLGYQFDWGDVSLLYRHIEWDLESGSHTDNINFRGPLLAAKFRF